MAYEERYRRRALEYWGEGHTLEETTTVFQVGKSALYRWKSQLNETGTLASKERETPWRKIDPERLRRYNDEHPDAFLEEIAAQFGCSDSAIAKAFKRIGISRKKNYRIP